MQWRSNQPMFRSCGSLLTAVGERRVSMGPPIRHGGARHQRMVQRFHPGDGGEDRNRGLADGRDMEIRPERREHGDAVIDVIVEVEAPVRERHLLGIGPVGDEHLMGLEEGRDRAAQKGRVMSRQRSHQQQLRLGRRLPERDDPAERPLPDHAFRNPQIEGGLGIGARSALEQFAGGGHGTAAGRISQGAERVLADRPRHLRRHPHGRQQLIVGVTHQVQHRGVSSGGPEPRNSTTPNVCAL